MATYIAELHDEATINVPEQHVQAALDAEAARGAGQGLDAEQERALRALCSPAGWAGTVGIAGSGKTTTLRPAVDAMQAAGYQVLGVALAGGAAEVLQAETGAPSWNIADFLVRCESGSLWAPDGRPLSLGPQRQRDGGGKRSHLAKSDEAIGDQATKVKNGAGRDPGLDFVQAGFCA